MLNGKKSRYKKSIIPLESSTKTGKTYHARREGGVSGKRTAGGATLDTGDVLFLIGVLVCSLYKIGYVHLKRFKTYNVTSNR